MMFEKSARALTVTVAVCVLGSTGAQAGNSDRQEAYQTCIRAIANDIGVRHYTVFERKHAQGVDTAQGMYRFYINSTYKHPELEAVRQYRAVCESGGFARLKSVTVQAGQWKYPEGQRGFLTVQDEEDWLAMQMQ